MKEKIFTVILSFLAIAILVAMVIFGSGVFKGKTNKNKMLKEVVSITTPTPTEETEDLNEVVENTDGENIEKSEKNRKNDFVRECLIKPGDKIVAPQGVIRFEDFTITLPKEYAAKVVILGADNGFSLLQKMSYDYEEGTGFLVSFNKTDNCIATFAGERMLKYTPSNMYYANFPTDVPYAVELDGATEDYNTLMNLTDAVCETLTVDSDEVYSAKDYVLPMSEFKDVDKDLLEALDIDTLNIALREIGARHGESFENDVYYDAHFSKCIWYTPSDKKITQNDFSDIEKRNYEAISAQIDKYRENNPYPVAIKFEETQDVILNDDIGPVSVCYYVSGDSEKGYRGHLLIDDDKYTLADFGIKLNSPVGDNFYITDIDVNDSMREIAVVDQVDEDKLITYFFTMDQRSVYCMNGIPGCPIPGVTESGFNGFLVSGMVSSPDISDLVFKLPIKVNYWLDVDSHTLTTNEEYDYIYEVVLNSDSYKTVQNLLLRPAFYDDGMSDMIRLEEGTKVFIIGSDNASTLQIKAEDGREGFLSVTEDMKNDPSMYFIKVLE